MGGGSGDTALGRAKKELQMEELNSDKAGKERGRKSVDSIV